MAFKRDVLEAFEGEPVVVTVSRRERAFGVRVEDPNGGTSIFGTTTDTATPDRAARRAFALTLFKGLVEHVASVRREEAAAALREQFGSTVN